jgi:hypothetical protein
MEETIVTDVDGQGSETQPETMETTNTTDDGGFFVPDEYKEQGWAKNISSYEDLWKMNANAQSLIGKKTIGIPTSTSTDEEWNDYYSKIRPEKAEYGLEEWDEDNQAVSEVFHKYGLAEKQAKGISTELKAIQNKWEQELFSQDGFDKEMSSRFGKDFGDKAKAITDFIKKEANDVDRVALERMPNNIVGAVYGLIDKVRTRYAVKDTDTAKNGGGKVNTQPDWLKYNEAMNELRTRPHTTADMQSLRDKYNIPYTK